MLAATPCPLCETVSSRFYYQDRRRDYYQCTQCELVYVRPEQRLSAEQEKAEYDLHQNSPEDKGYRLFLSRIADPLMDRLAVGSCGLDFGCGPGPTLSLMLKQAGMEMNVYDVFYHANSQALTRSYDFITATEVVEHLHQPGQVIRQLWRLLTDGGLLAIMTKRVLGPEAFANWHYKNDPTHVCFFSEETFFWLAKTLKAELSFIDKDVVFLSKTNST